METAEKTGWGATVNKYTIQDVRNIFDLLKANGGSIAKVYTVMEDDERCTRKWTFRSQRKEWLYLIEEVKTAMDRDNKKEFYDFAVKWIERKNGKCPKTIPA